MNAEAINLMQLSKTDHDNLLRALSNVRAKRKLGSRQAQLVSRYNEICNQLDKELAIKQKKQIDKVLPTLGLTSIQQLKECRQYFDRIDKAHDEVKRYGIPTPPEDHTKIAIQKFGKKFAIFLVW